MDHSIYIYGMKFPNRLFVGGLSKFAEAKELADFFEFFGTVIDAKIIMNKHGASKGYGFVTFSGKTDVENVIKQGQLFFQGKKLNIGPAVRKQVFNNSLPWCGIKVFIFLRETGAVKTPINNFVLDT
ncbi:protein boule-like [Hydractinia symbiolongicarpus]|uniref:protein boule-like n=1 Tax=Hydractinia symbiolongicarpus TaxID=13093 RepID=UPI0025501C78|nr:protein boule-like [Hydractinia symbiolongicarpus]